MEKPIKTVHANLRLEQVDYIVAIMEETGLSFGAVLRSIVDGHIEERSHVRADESTD